MFTDIVGSFNNWLKDIVYNLTSEPNKVLDENRCTYRLHQTSKAT